MKYSFFLILLFLSLNAQSAPIDCKTDTYIYKPLPLDSANSYSDVSLKLFVGDAIPKSKRSVIETELGSVKHFYEITATEGKSERRVATLYEACSQNGIIFCKLDDFNDLKDRGVTDNLGLFDVVKVYESNEKLSRKPTKANPAPKLIFFSEESHFYFMRGRGIEVRNTIENDGSKFRKPLYDLTSWKFFGCQE